MDEYNICNNLIQVLVLYAKQQKSHLVLCRHFLIGGDVGDDLFGGCIPKHQILFQLAQICQVLGINDLVDLAGNLYMHCQA